MHEAPAFVKVFLLQAAGATAEPYGSAGCDLHGRCLRARVFAPRGRQCVCYYVFVLHLPAFLLILQRLLAFFHHGGRSDQAGKASFCVSPALGADLFLAKVEQAAEAEWPGLCTQMPMGCCPLVRGEEKEAESGTADTSLCCRK